jgi:hypothetical protein
MLTIPPHANRIIKSAVYGKCIVADYNNVRKDKCAEEFMRLKNCYIVSTSSCLTMNELAAKCTPESGETEIIEQTHRIPL